MGNIKQHIDNRIGDKIMTRIFCNNVKNKLERHIIGAISVHVVFDTMICDIESEHMVFRYTHKYISSVINNSISSLIIAEEIEREYARMIKKKYFK